MTSTIGVVGRGVVGQRIARQVALLDAEVTVVNIDPRVDVGGFAAVDVAILASPSPHHELVANLVDRGIGVVSVSDDLDDVRAMLDLDDRVRHADVALVVGAGMSPGLTGLLARYLAAQLATVDEIHIAIHGTAGPACAHRHHAALRGWAVGLHDGVWVPRRAGLGRELCWFPEPVGAYDCYVAELAAPLLLHASFPEAGRLTERVSANRRDRLTARLPMLSRPHPEGGVGAVRVEVRGADASGGRSTLIVGVAELVGTITAATATVMAGEAIAGRLDAGVVTTGQEELDTVGLLHRVERLGVRLQEFTGVPS
jgi:hypothetical protein